MTRCEGVSAGASSRPASSAAAPAGAVRLLAPAKLTLTLRITGVRSDGYHFVDAEMVTLDLCDELVVHPSAVASVEVIPEATAVDGADTGAASWDIPSDHSNLVMRALELAGRTAHVVVRKRIPPGAGLGGGSADAAAVLRWANRLTAGEMASTAAAGTTRRRRGQREPRTLVTPQMAATLGADVAFCLVGGRARVSGIGEVVDPLPFRAQRFVLWMPPIACDTAAVYSRWDALGGPAGANNDLESAATSLYPELAQWRDELARATGQPAQLAGSGSTWFVTAPSGAAPFGGSERVRAPDGVRVVAAQALRPM
ncbi:4-(cytidine 5'-diphospho)-2-C-methyl-D-erythritol kinase [Candidatus Poriferisodalis sp.]|uniref:4-(cytidine 5'-diphospho)-2-C-methyl-D-erythritol kinase n=1 Tax=Candidatus Poriferisodalis sp. TaxID=3101277 RepID=UPI003B01E365